MNYRSKNFSKNEVKKAEEYIDHLKSCCLSSSWGKRAGCICELPKAHEGLHLCAAPNCNETWEDHNVEQCEQESPDQWCPYEKQHPKRETVFSEEVES